MVINDNQSVLFGHRCSQSTQGKLTESCVDPQLHPYRLMSTQVRQGF